MSIRIFYDDVSYRYKGWRKIRNLILKLIAREKMIPGDLNIIITDDNKLKGINEEFLEHDYFTDVITFNYNEGRIIGGEVYISIETVKRNSKNYKVSLNDEVSRVMIHGVLHLAGYDDKNESDKRVMSRMEDYWLSKLGE